MITVDYILWKETREEQRKEKLEIPRGKEMIETDIIIII